METIFINTENSKADEEHKFVLNLSQGLGLRSSIKHDVLQNLSICFTWKNIRHQYKNIKLKIIAKILSLNCQMVLIQCQT